MQPQPKKNCPIDPLEPFYKDLPPEERQTLSFAQFYITGMGCAGCVSRISNVLMALVGVINVDVDLTRKIAGVVFNPKMANVQTMVIAIAQAAEDGHEPYHAHPLG